MVLITGASRGIGAAAARLAAARGYRVVVNYVRNADAADAVVAEVERQGSEAIAIQADVSVEAEIQHLFGEIDNRFGRLDALVNNAGIVDRIMRVEEMTAARLTRMFAVNAIGPILCAREAIRRMSTARGGRGGVIINVSSAAARLGSSMEYVDYAASKGAIDTFTIGLAKELPPGRSVSAPFAPGLPTDIHQSSEPTRLERIAPRIPMKRVAQPEEIAATIVWLLSDEATYVTGALLDVAGGL